MFLDVSKDIWGVKKMEIVLYNNKNIQSATDKIVQMNYTSIVFII